MSIDGCVRIENYLHVKILNFISNIFYIFLSSQTGTSIPSLYQEQAAGAAEVQQPKLVCLGDPCSAAQYIIVAKHDKVAIPLQDEGLTCALDKLFKMLWVCNVAYPVQLSSVYSFILKKVIC